MLISIISADFENHVKRDSIKNAMHSLSCQTSKNFEWIICHDGPKKTPYEDEFDFDKFGLKPKIIIPSKHQGQWGFPAREIAMQYAKGDFFLHMNIDNILYANCIQTLSEEISNSNRSLYVFGIFHHKLGRILTGNPIRLHEIDLLQVCVDRNIWEKLNFTFLGKDFYCCDGITIEEIGKLAEPKFIDKVLAENF